MPNKINWGILGPGKIAHKFVKGMQASGSGILISVASRSMERANAFANEYGAQKTYDSYEKLCLDKDTQAIYVATPHPQHFENVKLALRNKKAVLCEKPLTINRHQAQELIQTAKENNVFLMEAMWTKCFPLMLKLKKLVSDNTIGKVKEVRGSFNCAIKIDDPSSRAFNPDLAGGALLDIGIYPLSITHFLFGLPHNKSSEVQLGPTGVDLENKLTLEYKEGIVARLESSFINATENIFEIIGEKGSIVIPSPFWIPTKATLIIDNLSTELFEPMICNGYEYEAIEVAKCLENNKQESNIVNFQDTLEVLGMMDDFRKDWGLKYPME